MRIKNLLFVALGLLAMMASCSKESEPVNPTDNSSLATSTALTYVSIYADKACTQPIVENAPLTGATTSINCAISYSLDNVYIKYPTANGTKVIEKSVASLTSGRTSGISVKADPGSQQYFDTENDKYYTIEVAKPEDAVKNYVTVDGGFTNYHSSGVVMFEDTWPSKSNTDKASAGLFGDFNDFVVDYDLEATVNDEANPYQTWKEDLKVVMHVRAMGGTYAQRFGLLLEGLDKKYVDDSKTEIKVTVGNYGEPVDGHAVTAEVVWQGNNPIVYINNLQRLINKTDAAANGLKLDSTYGLYNVMNDESLNVGKGLFTITVTFRGTDRNSLSKEDGDAQIANYKDAVINTNLQNFFLVTKQSGKTYEIHMGGYNPTDSYTTYDADKNDTAAGVAVDKSSINYTAADGQVWGLKTPVLTRHATEHNGFTTGYPLYLDWVINRNVNSKKWFTIDNAIKENRDEYIIKEW